MCHGGLKIILAFCREFFATLKSSGVVIITSNGDARKRAQSLDALLLLMFAVPSTVLGLGSIKLWNQSIFGGTVYNTFIIVIIAYLARFLILPERMFLATFKQIPPSFEETAMIDGASTAQLWTRIRKFTS